MPTENRIQKCLITDLCFVRLVLVFTCKKGPRANNPGFFFNAEIFFVILAKIFTEKEGAWNFSGVLMRFWLGVRVGVFRALGDLGMLRWCGG